MWNICIVKLGKEHEKTFTFRILFVCTSCGNTESEEPGNINDMMKINAWLLDDELEGIGCWGYISLE